MITKPGDTVTVDFTTQTAATGALTDADSMPTGTVSKNGTDDGAVTVTVSNKATGRYNASFTVPVAYVAGDEVDLYIAATVATIAGGGVVWRATIDTKRVSDLNDATQVAAPLDAAGTRAAVGLATANLDTQLADLPTVSEFEARTIASADYFVVSDYTAPLDASGIRSAVGLGAANLDTQLADLPTAAEILSEFGTGSTLTALVTATSVTVSDKTGFSLTTAYDLYHADIQLTKDDANSQDEWTVTWFKNGIRVSSGITVPTIQVVKRADGTDLVAAASMTQIGTTGSYKYDEATNRITAGEAVLAVATATIDASSRSFSKLITRDTTS